MFPCFYIRDNCFKKEVMATCWPMQLLNIWESLNAVIERTKKTIFLAYYIRFLFYKKPTAQAPRANTGEAYLHQMLMYISLFIYIDTFTCQYTILLKAKSIFQNCATKAYCRLPIIVVFTRSVISELLDCLGHHSLNFKNMQLNTKIAYKCFLKCWFEQQFCFIAHMCYVSRHVQVQSLFWKYVC